MTARNPGDCGGKLRSPTQENYGASANKRHYSRLGKLTALYAAHRSEARRSRYSFLGEVGEYVDFVRMNKKEFRIIQAHPFWTKRSKPRGSGVANWVLPIVMNARTATAKARARKYASRLDEMHRRGIAGKEDIEAAFLKEKIDPQKSSQPPDDEVSNRGKKQDRPESGRGNSKSVRRSQTSSFEDHLTDLDQETTLVVKGDRTVIARILKKKRVRITLNLTKQDDGWVDVAIQPSRHSANLKSSKVRI